MKIYVGGVGICFSSIRPVCVPEGPGQCSAGIPGVLLCCVVFRIECVSVFHGVCYGVWC